MHQPLAAVSVSQSFQNLLDTVFHSVPKILVFLVILVVGWIIAKLLARAIVMILHRVRFDHFVERGVVGQALSRSNYDASGLIAKVGYYLVLLMTLQLAFGVFGTNPISTMLDAIVGWLPKAVVAIVLIVVASSTSRHTAASRSDSQSSPASHPSPASQPDPAPRPSPASRTSPASGPRPASRTSPDVRGHQPRATAASVNPCA